MASQRDACVLCHVQAISSLDTDDQGKEEAAKAAREWAAVKVKPEDVDLIANELDVPKDLAELTLKQQQGNVVEALRKLLE